MKTYFEFIRPTSRNMVLLDILFLLLGIVKLFFVKDFPWVFVFSGYITFWAVTTIGYLWSKYKGHVD